MKQGPRNIIWITTDHMRYDCVGAHGNAAMNTPNLDRLVDEGISFSHCYANNPLCMPSRCSFMTGCYPQQTGVMNNGHELPADFKPVAAQSFSAAGYRTVQIGKLHFQPHEDHDLDPRARNAYGFDVFHLSEEPGCYDDAYVKWLRGEYPDLVTTFAVDRPMTAGRRGSQMTALDAPWQASHSGWIGTQACRYLNAWGPRPEPQFMHLGFYAPHPPLNPTREMFAPYRDAKLPEPLLSENDWRAPYSADREQLIEYRRHFYAMVTGVDLAVGLVLDELERMGQLDDTLIVFGSDHGDFCGDHGMCGKNPAYYESVVRMPWVMRWPDGFGTKSRRIDELVEMIDILPTLLMLAGQRPHPAMQGRSYAGALVGGDAVDGRSDVYAVHGGGDMMLRTRTHKYLRYFRGSGIEEVLYDLDKDPHEFRNVVELPEYGDVLFALRDRAFTRTVEASRSIRPKRCRF